MSPAEITVVQSLNDSLRAAVISHIQGSGLGSQFQFADPASDSHTHSDHDCCSSGACGSEASDSEHYQLQNVITAIDCATFIEDFNGDSELPEILAQQIEQADSVVLSEPSPEAYKIVHALNPMARVVTGPINSLDVAQLLAPPPESGSTDLEVVFRARKPFHPERFFEALQDQWGKTLRSKGHFWLASRPDQTVIWSQAGSFASIEAAGKWLAAIPQEQWLEEWDLDPAELERVQANWDPQFGDREQEITLIGAPQGLIETLNSCLLSDEELALGRNYWQNSSDPFPAWN